MLVFAARTLLRVELALPVIASGKVTHTVAHLCAPPRRRSVGRTLTIALASGTVPSSRAWPAEHLALAIPLQRRAWDCQALGAYRRLISAHSFARLACKSIAPHIRILRMAHLTPLH